MDRAEDRKDGSKMEVKRVRANEVLVNAKDVDNDCVQDPLQLVVVGAVALFPNLTDIEVANLCYEAIMKSKISFNNINYRKARLYIAINMNKLD